MTPEQIAKHIEKDLDDSYIHVYPENEKVVCKVQGNGLILFTMIDQALSGISEKSGMSYDQALSTLKLIHKNRRSIDDVVINKILGDL